MADVTGVVWTLVGLLAAALGVLSAATLSAVARIDGVRVELGDRIGRLDDRIDRLEGRLEARFDRLEDRMTSLEGRRGGL